MSICFYTHCPTLTCITSSFWVYDIYIYIYYVCLSWRYSAKGPKALRFSVYDWSIAKHGIILPQVDDLAGGYGKDLVFIQRRLVYRWGVGVASSGRLL